MVWDGWNRMVKVYKDNGTGNSGSLVVADPPEGQTVDTLIATDSYDGANRRIRKVLAGDPDVAWDYYYNETWQVLEERKDADADPYAQYLWDIRYIDAAVCRWRDANIDGDLADEGDDTLFYANDANMNVTALANTSGTVVERYLYDPYGQCKTYSDDWTTELAAWENTKRNEVRYCGYKYDAETGLDDARTRLRNGPLGWISRDSVEYADSLNVYLYGLCSPLNHTDPLGRFPPLGWPWDMEPCVPAPPGVAPQPTYPQPYSTQPPATKGATEIRDASGRIVGTVDYSNVNCIGYAVGLGGAYQPAVTTQPDSPSLRQFIEAAGFKCTESSAKWLNCPNCSDERIIVYLYQVEPKTDAHGRTRDPWQGPYVPSTVTLTAFIPGDGIHAVRADRGRGFAKWRNVPYLQTRGRIGGLDYDNAAGEDVSIDDSTSRYRTARRFHCCRSRQPGVMSAAATP